MLTPLAKQNEMNERTIKPGSATLVFQWKMLEWISVPLSSSWTLIIVALISQVMDYAQIRVSIAKCLSARGVQAACRSRRRWSEKIPAISKNRTPSTLSVKTSCCCYWSSYHTLGTRESREIPTWFRSWKMAGDRPISTAQASLHMSEEVEQSRGMVYNIGSVVALLAL